MAKKKKDKSYKSSMKIEGGSGKVKRAPMPSSPSLDKQKTSKKAKKKSSKIGFDRSKMSPAELAKDVEKAKKRMPVGVKSGETVAQAKKRSSGSSAKKALKRGYTVPKSIKKRNK